MPPGDVLEQSAARVGRRPRASAQRQVGVGDLRVRRLRGRGFRRRRRDVPGERARAGHRRGRARGRVYSRAQRQAGLVRRRLRARRRSQTGARRVLQHREGRAVARRHRRQRHGFGVGPGEEAPADAGGGRARRRGYLVLLLPRVPDPDDLGRRQRAEALDLRQPRRERPSAALPRRALRAAEARPVLRRAGHAAPERGRGRPRAARLLRDPGPAVAGAVAVARRAPCQAPENRRDGAEAAPGGVHGVERDARARLGERRDLPRGRAARVHVAPERRRPGRARPRASRASGARRDRGQQEPGERRRRLGVRQLRRRRRRQRRRAPVQHAVRRAPRRVQAGRFEKRGNSRAGKNRAGEVPGQPCQAAQPARRRAEHLERGGPLVRGGCVFEKQRVATSGARRARRRGDRGRKQRVVGDVWGKRRGRARLGVQLAKAARRDMSVVLVLIRELGVPAD